MYASRFIAGLQTVLLLVAATAAGEVNTALAEDSASVQGKVTIDGMPLAKGRIFFHVAKGQFIGAQIKDGEYVIDRAFAVRCPVTVEGPGVNQKYVDQEATSLVVDLKPGKNEVNLDLTSE